MILFFIVNTWIWINRCKHWLKSILEYIGNIKLNWTTLFPSCPVITQLFPSSAVSSLHQQPWLQGDSPVSSSNVSVFLPEVAGCQGLHQQLLPIGVALYLLNTGFKVHSAGCNYAVRAVVPRVKHSPLSVLTCLLQPGGNCIAVSPLLMSCRCNCFKVWPLVLQTVCLVKDPCRTDERWRTAISLRKHLHFTVVGHVMLAVCLVSSAPHNWIRKALL